MRKLENNPKVYFIILNFNSYEETIKCIRNLQCISYKDYEIIIVDNASKDSSVERIKKEFPLLKLLVSSENLGYAYGNNMGIKYALEKGADYICILNNDVVVEEKFLEPLIDILKSDATIGMVGPAICQYNARDTIQSMGAGINLLTGLAQAKHKNKAFSSMAGRDIEVDYLGGACFVVKREVIEKIGFIPENYFLFFEETEFCLKAKRKGFMLICTGKSRVYHKGSLTISKFKGLSYYFLCRNRVVFMRRNANTLERTIFYIYLFFEGLGRMLIRKESFELFKYYLDGISTDINSIDRSKLYHFFGGNQ